ncbi:hypothetical protein IMG5_187810 [Ichthyophthirius multifiliis]|uniref:Transmembrane protein n=1 Tax=Ichthyophthirius multifiliis TaxID=5932 RepID=G0R3W0_ICHMU|nr:hypothetical protein IMG5_187810 [Ichthyophthirius multifiliis]EGR27836.1 hypothetical protein IMG5_187810 [Ichthyophthirius multifiliis]|eukprot:XP_004027181.1 hypothetical protein IMG5_187810 [Ichthyophthirius multifiliis]
MNFLHRFFFNIFFHFLKDFLNLLKDLLYFFIQFIFQVQIFLFQQIFQALSFTFYYLLYLKQIPHLHKISRILYGFLTFNKIKKLQSFYQKFHFLYFLKTPYNLY